MLMGFGEIGLTLLTIFVLTVLSGILIKSVLSWYIKAIAILFSGLFFAITYFSIIDIKGWPTTQALPDDVKLISSEIRPPNKLIKYDGIIYLWVYEKNGDKISKIPRSYEIPYDKDTHKQLEQATRKMEEGNSPQGIKTFKMKKKRGKDMVEIDKMVIYELPIQQNLPDKK